jgi:hypothetical protein
VARRFRCGLADSGPFVCRCLNNLTLPRFHTPAYRTGQAELPHPALGNDSRRLKEACDAVRYSSTQPGVARLIVNPHVLRCFLRFLSVGSRTGAVLRRLGLSVAPRFLWECLTSRIVSQFPVPASSNPACRFPALGFPVCFLSRVMWLIRASDFQL